MKTWLWTIGWKSGMTVVAGTHHHPRGFFLFFLNVCLARVQRTNLSSYQAACFDPPPPAGAPHPDGVVLLHILAWLLDACAHGWRDSLALTSNICRLIHSSVDVKWHRGTSAEVQAIPATSPRKAPPHTPSPAARALLVASSLPPPPPPPLQRG